MTMHVHHLPVERTVVPQPVLAGPWRAIRLVTLSEGEQERLEAGPVEHALYVTRGEGTLESGPTGTRPIREGAGIVALAQSGATLRAGPPGLELFLVAVDVL
jgi:quercetin dioxygenase-like cupin family protein